MLKMLNFNFHKKELEEKGYSIIDEFFDIEETNSILELIEKKELDFSERQFLNKNTEIEEAIFSNSLFKEMIGAVCGEDYFLTKSLFFNKPSRSNWFVAYHQDLSISAEERVESKGFNNWTEKKGQLGVIPPASILENTFTFRIHLDDTDQTNGALRIINASHKKGIVRIDDNFIADSLGKEVICNVKKGGIMIMKPLLLHTSYKSTSESQRRVIHLEFCNRDIPMGWLEKKII